MPITARHIPLLNRVPIGARRAMLVRMVGGALACALALLAVIDPFLGIAAMLTVVVAAIYTQSSTFGVCAFLFVTYFELVTEYTGNTALSPIKVCGGALIVVALLDLVTRSRHGVARVKPTWARHPLVVTGLVAFVAIGMASSAWAVNTEQVRTLSERLVTDALIFLAIGVFLVRRGQLFALSCTALWAGALSTVAGIAIGAELGGRLMGTFTDPNEYAAAMVASIGLGFGVMGAARTWIGRGAAMFGVALCSYGVLASQSRSGLIAVLVATVVIVLSSRGRERVRMLGASALLVAGALAVLVMTPTGQGTLDRIVHGDSSGRSDLWRIAADMFRDQPVHGVGLGNFPAVANRYITIDTEHTELINNSAPRTTHNSYLEIAAELGLLGIVTFTIFAGGSVLLAARGLRRARWLEDATAVRLGRGILAATLGMLASSAFLSGQYSELLWGLLASCVAFHAWVARQVRMAEVLGQAPGDVDGLSLEGLGASLGAGLLEEDEALRLDANPLAMHH